MFLTQQGEPKLSRLVIIFRIGLLGEVNLYGRKV